MSGFVHVKTKVDPSYFKFAKQETDQHGYLGQVCQDPRFKQ